MIWCTYVHMYIYYYYTYIKTHSHVSEAKKDVWPQMYHLQEPLSHFLQHLISLTTVLISNKFKYFMPSIYTTLHTKFQENQISSLRDTGFWFSSHFLLHTDLKITLSQEKIMFPWIDFLHIWYTNNAHSGLS